ncbi:hypothetical protein [Aeromicrobium sp. UC242_57]|uniref:hypothetical protein n=1 Tax=Aeromicrobium sp. UC242_57 TaxID=3374624 RepID=UPI00379C0950
MQVCDPASVTFTAQTAGWTVPARDGGIDGALDVTLTGAVSMGPIADDACQGAPLTVYLQAGS